MITLAPASAPDLPSYLARMAVKSGVSLGGLSPADRHWALGCVWACLPAHTLTEPQINEHLRQTLAGPAGWLDTDHVELRRWLVDSGWVVRDGLGRAYQRVAPCELPAHIQAVGCELDALDVRAGVAQQRHLHEAARLARRQAWLNQA